MSIIIMSTLVRTNPLAAGRNLDPADQIGAGVREDFDVMAGVRFTTTGLPGRSGGGFRPGSLANGHRYQVITRRECSA
jgi:hypothetical protein